MSKHFKKFKGLWSSDQHGLHNRTPTTKIISSLNDFFYKEHDLTKTDLVLFGGDMFDRLVDSADDNLRLIQYWIRKFLNDCKKHDVVVRVLEGTHSHDMNQPETFVIQKPKGLDLKWITELSIERLERFNLTIMYMPDNMGHLTNEAIWNKALDCLSKSGLTSVNVLAAHTMWDYQAPYHISHKFHKSELWESIVDYVIFTGHVHIPSEHGKFRSSGSLDRLAHGEEHPKGGYEFEFNIDHKYFETKFWENKSALPYITMRYGIDVDEETIGNRIDRMIKNGTLYTHSRIRLKGENSSEINGVVGWLKQAYPHLNFDIDTTEVKKELIEEELVNENTYRGITIDKGNIKNMWLEHINEKDKNTISINKELVQMMKEFI